MMLYFAAPLFNEYERLRNLRLANELEAYSKVFLPQRDGTLLVDMLAAGVPLEVAERRVFSQDCIAIRQSVAVIAILDGAHLDDGVAFEIGFGRALGKMCVGLQTDVRRPLPSGNNPMIAGALDRLFNDESSLLHWASENRSLLAAAEVA
jgi:nucleoside 2-deoxyribosyltransferase